MLNQISQTSSSLAASFEKHIFTFILSMELQKLNKNHLNLRTTKEQNCNAPLIPSVQEMSILSSIPQVQSVKKIIKMKLAILHQRTKTSVPMSVLQTFQLFSYFMLILKENTISNNLIRFLWFKEYSCTLPQCLFLSLGWSVFAMDKSAQILVNTVFKPS